MKVTKLVLIALFALLGPTAVSADAIVQQLDYSGSQFGLTDVVYWGAYSGGLVQSFVAPATTTAQVFTIKAKSSVPRGLSAIIVNCGTRTDYTCYHSGGNYTSSQALTALGSTTSHLTTTSEASYSFYKPGGYELGAGNLYKLLIFQVPNDITLTNTLTLYGTYNSLQFPDGKCLTEHYESPLSDCAALADLYLYVGDDINDTGGVTGDSTFIQRIEPTRGSATSSPTSLSASVYVGAADLTSTTSIRVAFSLADLWQSGLLPAVVSKRQVYETYLTTPGWHDVRYNISGLEHEQQMWVNVETDARYIAASTTAFTVGTSTAWGQIQLSGLSREAAMVSALTATTTDGYAAQCAVWYGSSVAFHDCVTYLFVPSTIAIGDALNELGDTVMHVPPFGWFTRVYDIFKEADHGAATSTLPSLVVTLPTGYPGAGQGFDLTPWDSLLGPGTLLSEATNPDTGDTLYDIVYPTYSTAVYALVFIAIFLDLMGIGVGVAGESADINMAARRSNKIRAAKLRI